MDNPNMWHIRDQIFDPLNHETVLICRQVCQFWNESLARMSFLKLLQEFGDRYVSKHSEISDDEDFVEQEKPGNKVSTIVTGWKRAAKIFVAQASLEDLHEVKISLQKLVTEDGKCRKYPVHQAAWIGAMKLMEFILTTSVDMNSKDEYGWTPLHAACYNRKTKNFLPRLFKLNNYLIWDDDESTNRQTEAAQLIIQNSKDFGIDLNAKDEDGSTALHWACWNGRTETVQMILKNWKEFGIDIKVQNNRG